MPPRLARISAAGALCSIAVAGLEMLGWLFADARARGDINPSYPEWPVGLAILIALSAVVYAGCTALFRFLDGRLDGGRWRAIPLRPGTLRRVFLLACLLMALAWLPYLAVYFPGSLPWDGVRSMNQFTTDAPLENHHPVLMNMLYAGLMTLGRTMVSDNFGLLLIVLFQYASCVLCFSFAVRQLVALSAPRWLVVASLAFFALHPIWGVYAQAAFKDTLFNGVFCLFVATLIPLLTPRASRGQVIALAVSSLLMCFTRNNGIYVVAASLVAATVLHICRVRVKRGSPSALRAAKQAGAILAVSLVSYALAFGMLWPAMGVHTREDKEMLSIPFQQTARCVVEHPGDVSAEERAAIDAVLPYDDLPALYLPDLSDPVKEAVKGDGGEIAPDQKNAYFRAWAAMGLRHPLTYLEATIANTYAYWYPGIIIGEDIARPVFPLYIQGEPINATFDVHYVGPEGVRNAVGGALRAMLDVPVLNAMYSPAPFVLAFAALVAYAARRGNVRALVLAVPLAVLLATVLAGPLNGHLRYVLPLAAALPLLCALVLRKDGEGGIHV